MKRCLVAAAVALLSGCSTGGTLSQERLETTSERVSQLAESAGITLTSDDARCTARKLTDDVSIEIEDESASSEAFDAVGAALIGCLDPGVVARSALLPHAGGIREGSLDCAARTLDQAFVVELVTNAMAGNNVSGATGELAVVSAFAVCLGTDELLERQAGG